jgi:enamine deaminase RidA (YjgF/YER057c/UK114 family)
MTIKARESRMSRQQVFTGSPWEPLVGYCRAIRVGNRIEVAGTTAMQDGVVVGAGDPYAQARFVLQTIENALKELGADMSHVVRTRMFVTDISRWEEVGKAHGEFFGQIQPVATMVEVSALIDPLLMVEIEAEAIIDAEAETDGEITK